MPIKDHIEIEAVCVHKHNDRQYQVKLLNNGKIIRAQMGGKMVCHRIRVGLGDKVMVHFNEYNLDLCRIVRRL